MSGAVSLTGPGEAWLTTDDMVSFKDSLTLNSGQTLHVSVGSELGTVGHTLYAASLDVNGGELHVTAGRSGSFDIGALREDSDCSLTLSNGGRITFSLLDGDRYGSLSFDGSPFGSSYNLDFRGGLVSAPGANISLSADTVYSNNSMEASSVQVQQGCVLYEDAEIIIDGVGKKIDDGSGNVYYTYGYLETRPGQSVYGSAPPGTYHGDVIIELAEDAEKFDLDGDGVAEYAAGGYVLGGLHVGDIELRDGHLTFWAGGRVDGKLTIAGGQMSLRSPDGNAQIDDAEANISGGIEFTGGNLDIESGLALIMAEDIHIQVGSSISGLNAEVGTAQTLYMEGGSLEAGTFEAAAIEMSSGSLAAEQVNVSGNSAVSGGTVDAEQLTVAGSTLVSGEGTRLTLSGGSGATSSLNGLVVKNGAEAEIDCLEMESGADVQVGDAADTAGGSTVSFWHLNLNGGMLTVDPAWGLEPSNVAVENLSASHTAVDSVTINGSVGVGRNSYLAIGTSDTAWLPGKVEEATGGAGLSDGGVESALGLYKPLTVGSGKAVLVDGGLDTALLQASLNTSQDTAVFEAGSLLVLNGADAAMQGGTPAISFENANSGSVEVKNDARLLITDAVDGASYKISEAPINYEGGSYAATTAWKNENLLTSSAMVSLESLGEGGYLWPASMLPPASTPI